MLKSAPVTQRDVAIACNVHPSTICLALKDSPSIPLATRRRIRDVALRMGYRPNAAARNLALLRGEKSKSQGSLPLAWLNQEPARDFWREDRQGKRLYEAARSRASKLGYALADLWAAEPGLRIQRLIQILKTRGIEGVVCPVSQSSRPELMEELAKSFALVGMGDFRAAQWMDVVCPDHYQNTDLVLSELARCGEDRVGLVVDTAFDERSRGMVRSRYLAAEDDYPQLTLVPYHRLELSPVEEGRKDLAIWWREQLPDTVICGGRKALDLARQSFPASVRLICLENLDNDEEAVDENCSELAGCALERLASKLQRRDRWEGEGAQCISVKGSWNPQYKGKGEMEHWIAVAS